MERTSTALDTERIPEMFGVAHAHGGVPSEAAADATPLDITSGTGTEQAAASRIGDADRPLRIGMVAPVWVPIPPKGYGGVEWIVHSLVEGLGDRGHDVTLVSSGDSTTHAGHRFTTYDEAPYRRMGEPLPELIHAVEAYRELGDCDVIHDHTLAGPAMAQMLERSGGPAVVHTVHGPVIPEVRRYYADCSATNLVAISDAQQLTAPELNWAGTVHNGIDVSSFPFRADDDGYIAVLARMNPDKGIPEAIKLARELGLPIRIAAKLNEPAELDYYRRVIEPLLGLGAEYVGELQTAEKKEFLANARALAFPIQWDEPFGLAMIESLACGTPVLAIARGSVPEIVSDGLNGVTAANIDELIDACMQGIDHIDPYLCRSDAESRFDITAMVDGYEAQYRRLAATRSAFSAAA